MSVGDVDITKRGDIDQLKGNAVGLYSILFLCVTGSAPLAVFIYNTPFTMPYGSGSNGPSTFFFATIVLTIFSIAYAEMAKKVRAAGGMYTYVSHGLGQAWGLAAGYSLMIGYAIFGVALIGGFSSFAQAKWLQYSDTHVNWLWFALIGVVLVVYLAYFDVEISARVLGIALISEIVIIAISSIFLFAHANNVAIGPVLPWNGLHTGVAPGVAVFFAFWSWVGFEAAPNYAEEARDPVRVIPLALIFSCVAVGTLYTIMSWALVSAYGTGTDWTKIANTGSTAVINGKTVPADYNNFVLGPVSAAAGEFWRDALSWLIISGSLACAAALTNAGLRYMYAMGREGLLPRYLGKTHPVHKSPYTAVLTWGVGAVVLFLVFRATSHTGLDAYFWLSPQGVIWIVLVQALTALSVFTYFRREHPSERSWKTTICPWLGFVGQLFVLALFYHYETFVAAGSSIYVKELFTIGSGTFSVPVSWLGIIGVAVPVLSIGYAYLVRTRNPEKYALMGRFVNESA
jgi:amino acid transporter